MSAPTAGGTTAMPTDFFCEHLAHISRLLVVLHRAGHSPAAQTVLTFPSAGLAETAAGLLRQAAGYGHTHVCRPRSTG